MVPLYKYIKEPWRLVVSKKLSFLWPVYPDKLFIECMYRFHMGKELDLSTPKSFTEKLQWLKLYGFKPEYVDMVDKYEAKKIVADAIGDEYIIPTYGVWDRVEDIDISALPNEFVLKCTHDSNSYVICSDKSKFDAIAAKQRLQSHLKQNFFVFGREKPYKYIKPRIIAEKYMQDAACRDLRDYKFFTFHGEPRILHIVSNRQNAREETYGDCFDMNYDRVDISFGHPCSPIAPPKPENFEKMKEFARILAHGTKHLRVDFYEVDGKLYFGELTFYHDAGWGEISPSCWNDKMGSWIDIDWADDPATDQYKG